MLNNCIKKENILNLLKKPLIWRPMAVLIAVIVIDDDEINN
jgi:hypothetical protein